MEILDRKGASRNTLQQLSQFNKQLCCKLLFDTYQANYLKKGTI